MKVTETKLSGVLLIEPKVFRDDRGFFLETYSVKKYKEHGVSVDFVQDNFASSSRKGVLRGMHYQINHGQDKLVWVTEGSVFDVAVDVRPDSPTFGQWVGYTLSSENCLQLFVPVGFAHGYCVLTDTAKFQYKCSDYYHPEDEGGLIWNDPEVGIKWPVDQPLLSEKDAILPKLRDSVPPKLR